MVAGRSWGNRLWSYLNFIALMFPLTKYILLTRNIEDIMKSGWWAMDGNPETAAKAIEPFIYWQGKRQLRSFLSSTIAISNRRAPAFTDLPISSDKNTSRRSMMF